MEKLDFQMYEFNRMAWRNDIAEEVWGYRIRRISNAISQLERLSVIEGIRKGCLDYLRPSQLKTMSEELAEYGLIPIAINAHPVISSYSIRETEANDNEPVLIRVFMTKPEYAIEILKNYFKEKGNLVNGKYLSYPECCTLFFEDIWQQKRYCDTTWFMAQNTKNKEKKGNCIEIKESPIWSNTLLRWAGVRPVFHMPCSLDCEETQELGKKIIQLGYEKGFNEEMDWLKEILSWRVKWSALHGIAMIETPLFITVTMTDTTPDKYEVIRHGKELEDIKLPEEWLWKDNGFSSYEGMCESHLPLLKTIKEIKGKSILDLGCGNGYLAYSTGLIPYGLDLNEKAINRAKKMFPEHKDNFFHMNISDYKWNIDTDIVVMSAGRLMEMSMEQRKQMKKNMINYKGTIVVESYGDWLYAYGSLEALCNRVGLKIEKKYENDYASTGIVTGIIP